MDRAGSSRLAAREGCELGHFQSTLCVRTRAVAPPQPDAVFPVELLDAARGDLGLDRLQREALASLPHQVARRLVHPGQDRARASEAGTRDRPSPWRRPPLCAGPDGISSIISSSTTLPGASPRSLRMWRRACPPNPAVRSPCPGRSERLPHRAERGRPRGRRANQGLDNLRRFVVGLLRT